jgi:hypothetical protein
MLKEMKNSKNGSAQLFNAIISAIRPWLGISARQIFNKIEKNTYNINKTKYRFRLFASRNFFLKDALKAQKNSRIYKHKFFRLIPLITPSFISKAWSTKKANIKI